jgi:hypothetical protein
MKAIVTKGFLGVKDGEVYPTNFVPGHEVEGDLAAVAVKEGWAKAGGSGRKAAPASKPGDGSDITDGVSGDDSDEGDDFGAKSLGGAPENK